MSVAAPIAKAILEDAIVALDIEPLDGGIDKEYRYYETKYVKVPDVLGMTPKEARSYLSNFDIEYSGNGETIISVSPKVGSSVPMDSVIRLMLG